MSRRPIAAILVLSLLISMGVGLATLVATRLGPFPVLLLIGSFLLTVVAVHRSRAYRPNGREGFVPKVSPEDVERIVLREFGHGNRDSIFAVLNEFSQPRLKMNPFRVWLAILKLSNGNIELVRQNARLAQRDFRNVLMPAEYPQAWKLGPIAIQQMGADELKRLREADWAQYQEWLLRT